MSRRGSPGGHNDKRSRPDGPWTRLDDDDDMYDLPLGVLVSQVVKSNSHIKDIVEKTLRHNEFRIVGKPLFGPNSGSTIERLKSAAGNRRPAKKPGASNYAEEEEDEIDKIRRLLQVAYEEFIVENTTEKFYKPKATSVDTKFYLSQLIGRLSDIKRKDEEGRKERENEERKVNTEIEEFQLEIEDFSKTFNLPHCDDQHKGLQKKLRLLRIQLDKEKKKYVNSFSKRRHDANKNGTDKTAAIKERIRKLLDNIPEMPEIPVQKRTESVEDMLHFIELALHKNQQELKRFNQEKDIIHKELQRLRNNVVGKDKEFKLETNDENENEVLKTIRQIRQKLVSEKHLESERQLKLENKCKDQTKTLEELWNILNEEEQQQKQEGKEFVKFGVVDGKSNGEIIVEQLNRWKSDRTLLVTLTATLVRDISTLLIKEPFSFTLLKQFDTAKVAQGLTPASQEVVIGMNDIKRCLEENCKSFENKFVSVKLLTEARECQTDLRKEIKGLKKENDELLNRLSKLAGANLTDNNPAIADLSDPNRATKLAEQFSELYDTPWTDAFDALKTDDEKRCIEYLLNIIVESYKLCEEISVIQQDTLARAICRPLEGLKEKTVKMKHDRDVHLSKIQSKALSDLRKQTADLSIVDVKTHIVAKNVHWVKNSDLKQFTMSCIELCWYMHLQSPPVYLDATLVTDSKFDSNKYKSYTKSGKKVDFLVWPSLLLHKDGPLLCKGVAQGK